MRSAPPYTKLRSVQFPLYEGYTANDDAGPKRVTVLRELIEQAQRAEFGDRAKDFWELFLREGSETARDYEGWKEGLEQARGGGSDPTIFLGHRSSRLPDFLLPGVGQIGRNSGASFRVDADRWKANFEKIRLAVFEHVSAYYHRPHLMCYDVHEHLRVKLPPREKALIWLVVPGRRGRIFEARSAFLRESRCPDLSYHHYSDTARVALYGLIDSHVYVQRVTVGPQRRDARGDQSIFEQLGRIKAADLKNIWALQWDEPGLDELAEQCLREALDNPDSNAYAYTERHFFWFVTGGSNAPKVGRSSRLRAMGTLCASADEVQRLLPDIEFWTCGITHTKRPEDPDPASIFPSPREKSPSIDTAQTIENTVEYGYQWPYFFDRKVANFCDGLVRTSTERNVQAVLAPWMKCPDKLWRDCEGAIGRALSEGASESFLAYPRFFQSRVVTPVADSPAASEPVDGLSLAHVYQLATGIPDDYLRLRVLYAGKEFENMSGPAARPFPIALKGQMEAARAYVENLGQKEGGVEELRTELEAYFEKSAPVAARLRKLGERGSVWFIGVGYSHRRSRIVDPDIVSAPDLRAGFFAIFYVPSGATGVERALDRFETHKGRVVANIERILAKLAAELVEERDGQERLALVKAKAILNEAIGPINRMMQLQRQARDEAELLALAVDLPGSTLLQGRDIAADMFREGGHLQVSRDLSFAASHAGWDQTFSREVLAYFIVRFFRRDDELRSIHSGEQLIARGASVLLEAYRNPTREVITLQVEKLLLSESPGGSTEENAITANGEPSKRLESTGLEVVQALFFGGETAKKNARVALERIKLTLHTAFKINALWDSKVAEIVLHTVTAPSRAGDSQSQSGDSKSFRANLPLSHGQWLDATLMLAHSYLRTNYLEFKRKGFVRVEVTPDRYEITLERGWSRVSEAGPRTAAMMLSAFKLGLATGSDPRLASMPLGDLSSALQLFGSLFRFVNEHDEKIRRNLFGWVRFEPTMEILNDDDVCRFKMEIRLLEETVEFRFAMKEHALTVGLYQTTAVFGHDEGGGDARDPHSAKQESADSGGTGIPATGAGTAVTNIWFVDHENHPASVGEKLTRVGRSVGVSVELKQLSPEITSESLINELNRQPDLVILVHVGNDPTNELRFSNWSHPRGWGYSKYGVPKGRGFTGADLAVMSDGALATLLEKVSSRP